MGVHFPISKGWKRRLKRMKSREQKELIQQELSRLLGNPEQEEFRLAAEAWERKEINAVRGAAICGMGVSTFYRRLSNIKNYKAALDSREEDKDEKEA